jgi:cytochrome c
MDSRSNYPYLVLIQHGATMLHVAVRPALLAIALLGSGAVHASPELAKSRNCVACHAVDKKLIGPAYKDIAAKYASDKDAITLLAKKVRAGSVGVWGQIPMPANPQVSADDAITLVTWVLSAK